ncbi:hypothetical protein HJFPF1_01973 [Paramyrothecium foliicola]|nr:hypothetical protein HJFPF1_01973 [Paramyrothecium foliicola]
MLKTASHWQWNPAIDRLEGDDALQALAVAAEQFVGASQTAPLRFKILLDRDGNLTFEKYNATETPVENLFPRRLPPPEAEASRGDPCKTPRYAIVLDSAISSKSEYTHFKTTVRQVYDAARERARVAPPDHKEVLIVNKDNEVMEGTLTTPYFWRNDRWVTPPVAPQYGRDEGSGGQDGTSRRWALERGLAVEEVVSAHSLTDGEECWISNGRNDISANDYIGGVYVLTLERALDYRAATFEALGELERARKDAEWILELAPRLPDGYLRLGKISRLQKKHDFAWKLYNAGIEATGNCIAADSPKLQALYAARRPLQSRYSRIDPLHLPPEIIQMIFSQLDLYTLVTWNQTLVGPGYRHLWRKLCFTDPRRRIAPGIASLRKLLTYSGNDVRELVIGNATRFRLSNQKFLALLNSAKAIERLEIGQPYENLVIPNQASSNRKFMNKLNTLVLDAVVRANDQTYANGVDYPYSLIQDAAENLQHLHIRCDTNRFPVAATGSQLWPCMPELRCLRLEKTCERRVELDIVALARQSVNLEQLWLDGISPKAIQVAGPEETLWAHLKAMVYLDAMGPTIPESLVEFNSASCRSRLANIRYLELKHSLREDAGSNRPIPLLFAILAIPVSAVDTINGYAQLQCIRLTRAVFDPQRIQSVLASSFEAGKLRTLDIVFPLEDPNAPLGSSSVNYLKGYGWLRGAESIRCLGIFGFRFVRYPRNVADDPLPDFLASFPNLDTLEIHSEEYEDAELCTLIASILKVTHLKTLYESRVKGVPRDQLRGLTQKHGVQLIGGERPRQWPVPLDTRS